MLIAVFIVALLIYKAKRCRSGSNLVRQPAAKARRKPVAVGGHADPRRGIG
jgi:hypothetical protein